MSKVLQILVAYIHDFASALWIVSVLAVYWIDRTVVPSGTEEFFFQFKREFFYIGIASLVVILLTGAGRAYWYISGQFGQEAEKMRRKILIIKHIIGFIIYGGGTYWQYLMVYG
jgi:uncharacterized membrane protein